MKNINRYPTATSHQAARSLFAIGVALTAIAAPAVLTGCGSGGGGKPDPSSSTSGNQTVITGRIVDVNAGFAGVSGARVTFGGVSVQTNSSGNFTLTVPRNTANGTATITAPTGATFYSFAANTAGCANALTFSVTGPLSGANFAVGDIFVYGRSENSTPNPPCI